MRLTRLKNPLVIAACIAMLALSATSSPVLAFTADELAAKNLAARGGLDKLQAITTLTRSGKLLVNGGQLRLDFKQMQKRVGMIRDEATLQGLTVVQAHDGKEGWQINPFQGRKDPERTPPDDNKGLIEDADFDGPLVDYKAKGNALEYVGTEDVDGTPALKLKLTRANGDTEYLYLDPDYFLEIRTISRRIEHGVPIEIQSDFGDYEQIDGAYFPFAISSGPKGSADVQKVQFDSGNANLKIADAKFHFPAPGVKVGPATIDDQQAKP